MLDLSPFICCLIFAARLCLAQQKCQPLPAVMQPPPGDKNIPTQLEGLWYRYRQTNQFGRAASTLNQRMLWGAIAPTVDKNNKPALAMWRQEAQYTAPENTTCRNHYWLGVYSEDGNQFGNAAVTEDNFVMRQANDVILYHDYAKLVIGYACFAPQLNGTCAFPVVFAQTRAKPTDLSAAERANFDKLITGIFAPYCMKANDVPLQFYSNDKEFCPFIDPPPCMAQTIQGFGMTKAAVEGFQFRSAGVVAKCQMPNSIQGAVSYDPAQAAGLWYGYRFKYLDGISTINAQFSWHNLGKTSTPMPNNVSSYVGWMEIIFTNTSSCYFSYYVGDMATNGQGRGYLGPLTNAGEKIIVTPSVLYSDKDFVLYYACIAPDAASGCRIPFVLAGSRKNPDDLALADKNRFDLIIGSVVGKFGCDLADIPVVERNGDFSCSFQGADQCTQLQAKGLGDIVVRTAAPKSKSQKGAKGQR